ncbi:uncharacterized protein LOC144300455 [Canis aureus]
MSVPPGHTSNCGTRFVQQYLFSPLLGPGIRDKADNTKPEMHPKTPSPRDDTHFSQNSEGCLLDISLRDYSNLCQRSRSGASCCPSHLLGYQAAECQPANNPRGVVEPISSTSPPKSG